MATVANGIQQPVCQNCTTSTTPLWRRDESGAVLCNACGLFLKLHGTSRPISLKTDIIKSRNRVKTAGQQGQKRKSLFENGLPASQTPQTHPQQTNQQQQPQQTNPNGSQRSGSPLSRALTPGLNHLSNIAPQHMFDGVSLSDHAFQSPALPNIPLRQPSPGSSSSNADRHLEPPQTYDGLLQANSALKTRVNELEVINGLYQGHVRQYQQDQQPPAPQAEMIPQDSSEASLRQLLQQSQQREEDLNRRLEKLERELAEARGEEPPAAKRTRTSADEGSEYPDPPVSIT